MALPEATVAHYERQQRITALTLTEARRLWGQMGRDFDGSWRRVGPRLAVLMAAMQQTAARDALASVAPVLDELGINAPLAGRVNVAPLIGVASDGRPLDTLLYEPVIAAKVAVGAGASPAQGLSSGLASLEAIVLTQIPDAARIAAGLGITARPRLTGYVRMLNPPSCSRCAVLAGKWFRWNEGFQRHNRCDCRHIPASEDMAGDLRTDPDAYFHSLSEVDQDRAFTKAGAQAIRDGADIGQVVNARRGATGLAPAGARITEAEARMLRGGRDRGRLQTTRVFGQDVFTTTEGTTRRGIAGQRLGARSGFQGESAETVTRNTRRGVEERQVTRQRARAPRLMPESIYAIANDRDDALRLLRRYGYII